MTRILIADDHAVLRKGLKQIILEEYPNAIIGEAADADELIKNVRNEKWDLVICDISMPGRSGLEALKEIKQITPDLPVLIMSVYPEDQYALRVLKAGASGYVNKALVQEDIVKAIETVRSGRKFITPGVAEKLLGTWETNGQKQPHEILSEREFDVFLLIASGKSPASITETLSLSATTISTYRKRLLEKMKMKSNSELIRYALEKKLI